MFALIDHCAPSPVEGCLHGVYLFQRKCIVTLFNLRIRIVLEVLIDLVVQLIESLLKKKKKNESI
jgi:hypothetical protein